MPDPSHRATSPSALSRIQEKYILAPTVEHPHRFYFPIKDLTYKFREMMKTKNYVRIMTQVDLCRWILTQWYIYCAEDIWICGDAMILNAEPSKKILCQPMCVRTRRTCPAHYSESREFFLICPSCRNLGVAVKGTFWKCSKCKQSIPYNLVGDVPFIVMGCADCPVKIGEEGVKANIKKKANYYIKKLQVRQHVAERKIGDMMEDLKQSSLKGEEGL